MSVENLVNLIYPTSTKPTTIIMDTEPTSQFFNPALTQSSYSVSSVDAQLSFQDDPVRFGLPTHFGRPDQQSDRDRTDDAYDIAGRMTNEWALAPPQSKYDLMSEEELAEERERIESSVQQEMVFDDVQCREIERKIDEMVEIAESNGFKHHTVDRTALRVKYFFGEGYTYGAQMARMGPGQERLYARGEVDEIPQWILDLVLQPLIDAKIIAEGFVNSAAVNDYQPGGCIVSHIDPPHIFDRPIYTVTFISDSVLSFGCRFAFRPIRCSRPILALPVLRGQVTAINGYSANEVTHCIRPEDITSRRAVIILRRVLPDAPRLPTSLSFSPSTAAPPFYSDGPFDANEARSKGDWITDTFEPSIESSSSVEFARSYKYSADGAYRYRKYVTLPMGAGLGVKGNDGQATSSSTLSTSSQHSRVHARRSCCLCTLRTCRFYTLRLRVTQGVPRLKRNKTNSCFVGTTQNIRELERCRFDDEALKSCCKPRKTETRNETETPKLNRRTMYVIVCSGSYGW